MKARIIYLQSAFWKQLKADTSIAGLQCLMNVYEAITDANLRTDIEDEVWDDDPFLILLWKKYLQSQADVELFEKISIDKFEENAEDLSAVYLVNENSETCDNLGVQYGVAVINNTDMPRKEYLFKGDGFLLKKNAICYEDRYLQFKSKLLYPCNAMILIDPYILTKEQNIDNNLFPLLDAILPSRKLQLVFQIAIFSMIGEKNQNATNGDSTFIRVKNLITALRKGLNFDLTLYAISHSEEFHSRMIITNNVLLSAADGFEVFKDDGKASKNAKFDIVMPRLVGDSRQDMSNYLRWIKVAKTRSIRQSETQYWGTRENRLFDLV